MEITQDRVYLNSIIVSFEDLPMSFGGEYTYTISLEQHDKYVKKIRIDLGNDSHMIFKFYKQYLTISVSGHAADFGDSVGLLREYGT